MRPIVEEASERVIIRYLGVLPRCEALKILVGSDVMLLPSRDEGASTVIPEDTALKVPVIATKVEGNPEVLRDGVDGILIEPKPEEICRVLERRN